ncbi:IclR family transcriptional regulator [Natrononativus amylolyticus]|uniref:IclR family transcriptional regulator n=1 Tax=Natrononativus amylolyticus TaxID=2963434 RepID=UPI0020CD5934|nr:IclR family transcriptional regulator [Natrononativus amylolyticus]
MRKENNQEPIKSVVTAFEVLEIMQNCNGLTVSDLSREAELPKSTAYRYLSTLKDCGYVVKSNNSYNLGMRFLDFGEHACSRNPNYELAKRKTRELAQKTKERAHFIIEEHGLATYVFMQMGENAVRTNRRVGQREKLHSTAAGKAIMAAWSDREIEQYLETFSLDPQTPYTITDQDALWAEIKIIREQKFARNNQENLREIRAVATVVRDENDDVLGALSISGPISRVEDTWYEDKLPSIILEAATELEFSIRYP